MKLKGKKVVDRDENIVYPDILTYWQMREAFGAESVTLDDGRTFYAPFKIL